MRVERRRWVLKVSLGCWLLLAGAVSAAEPNSAISLFNGKDLAGWKFRGDEKKSQWTAGAARLDEKSPEKLVVGTAEETPELVNREHGVDIYTVEKFGDCTLSLELLVPKNSNSGVYLMGEYEVQILDSFGKKTVGPGDLGGIYNTSAPKVNAAKAPGEWQTLAIEFRAPRFDATGKKTENAKFIKVTLNGQIIQEQVETPHPTTACLTGKESAAGPLLLQGDHGPVAFRKLKLTPSP